MGFWNVLGKVAEVVVEKAPGVISALAEEGAKKRSQTLKSVERQISQREREISKAQQSDKMNNPEYARRVNEAKKKIENAKVSMYSGSTSSNIVKTNSSGKVTINRNTIEEWDRKWRSLGTLSELTLNDLTPYNHSIGLYKAEMKGKIYYIGRAIEYDNGGFRKRLRDYVRDSNSARKHISGGKMHENAERIQISILVVGNSAEEVEAVKALERALVMKYAPQWNVQFNR